MVSSNNKLKHKNSKEAFCKSLFTHLKISGNVFSFTGKLLGFNLSLPKKIAIFSFVTFVLLICCFVFNRFVSWQQENLALAGVGFQRVDSYIPFSQESYLQYEKAFKVALPRNGKGKVIITKTVARNNQIDAFRHAYVSGVFAMKYGNTVAKILGNSKEIYDDIFYNQSKQEKAMDYWNNAIGRRYGVMVKSRGNLAKILKESIIKRELVVETDDYRCYIVNQH
jgi:hypothetical protein